MGGFDQIFVNGNVLTMHRPQLVSAVAVAEGKVVAAGDERELRSQANSSTQLIDLEGRTLVPGFEDAHAHIWKVGQLLTTSLDLRRSKSIEEIGTLLKQRDTILPKGAWLLGRGFNEIALAEGCRPTRSDLDRFVADRPILLTRTCGHIFVANNLALKLAGIDSATAQPDGGIIERDSDNEPNGLLHETAVGLVNRVIPAPARADYRAMIDVALKHQLTRGITSSSDCGVLPGLLEAYLEMDADGTLPARMLVMPLGRPDGTTGPLSLPPKHQSPMLRVDTVKFLADGGLSGGTAALTVPYRNSSFSGVTRFQADELAALFADAHRQGWRISAHAIGDAAIEQVLGLYEQLGTHPNGLAHRIEHVGLPSATQLKRMFAADVFAVTQPIFLDELGANFKAFIPDQLESRVYPIRAMIDAGLTVAFSSDAPVVSDDSPLAGMQAAILRRSREGNSILPEQAVTAEEALIAYTVGSATVAGEEHTRGSIQPGRWADFAVLSADPTAVEPDAIRNIAVEQTYLAGKLVYSRQP
jgi:predicted amidohydrolase YtcJ